MRRWHIKLESMRCKFGQHSVKGLAVVELMMSVENILNKTEIKEINNILTFNTFKRPSIQTVDIHPKSNENMPRNHLYRNIYYCLKYCKEKHILQKRKYKYEYEFVINFYKIIRKRQTKKSIQINIIISSFIYIYK